LAGQIAVARKKTPDRRAAHLICGMPVWGIAGVIGCSYLAYISYAHVRQHEFDWSHDPWFILTSAVWILLMAGLISETRCWRERAFFALVLANFALGFTVALWKDAPASTVRQLREASAGLWALAALVSVMMTFSLPGSAGEGSSNV
jgi:hypothetical protein